VHLKVNINEKIHDQINPIVKACFDSGGSLLTTGSEITKEDSFSSLSILNGSTLISFGMGKVKGLPWKRSKINYDTSY
jgi:hypothetical protein